MDTDMETLADETDHASDGGEAERLEAEAEAEAEASVLRDRLRLAVIKIATSEGSILTHPSRGFSRRSHFLVLGVGIGIRKCLKRRRAVCAGKKAGMEVADPVVACIADLAYKSAEQLAKDVELFAQHAGRKSIKMEDVILTAHRNEHLIGLLRTFSQQLKGKEPSSERKRKKSSKKDDNVMQI
ncbi:hypothetical protein ABZP36_007531 [Zizania latifolia]